VGVGRQSAHRFVSPFYLFTFALPCLAREQESNQAPHHNPQARRQKVPAPITPASRPTRRKRESPTHAIRVRPTFPVASSGRTIIIHHHQHQQYLHYQPSISIHRQNASRGGARYVIFPALTTATSTTTRL